jgi:nicotinamidase-related amidase
VTLDSPEQTAVLCVECQQGVLGADAELPVPGQDTGGLISRIERLLAAARTVKVPVVHATFEGHLGGRPTGTAPLWQEMGRRSGHWAPGHPGTEVLPELLRSDDVVLPRHHGLAPTTETELMPVLRSWGVRTVVLTGVSVNVTIPLAAGELAHHGFGVLVPTDAVGGSPPDYAEQALRHTVALLATLTTVDELEAAWAAHPRAG